MWKGLENPKNRAVNDFLISCFILHLSYVNLCELITLKLLPLKSNMKIKSNTRHHFKMKGTIIKFRTVLLHWNASYFDWFLGRSVPCRMQKKKFRGTCVKWRNLFGALPEIIDACTESNNIWGASTASCRPSFHMEWNVYNINVSIHFCYRFHGVQLHYMRIYVYIMQLKYTYT